MKQILQSLRNGSTNVAEVPCPRVVRGQLLIQTAQTLVSAGTERMLVEFGKAGWIEKAIQQPDKVRMVLSKIQTDGLIPTIESVFNKLDQPLALGYCNVGRVIKVGAGVDGFLIGERVISNGKHAEVVSVPQNLCAKIPDCVADEEAAFTVLSAIALQGIRLVQPTLGETVAVTGLGLIGLLTVQLLRAHGCRVIGIDFDPEKLALARQFGAEVADLALAQDPVAFAQKYSRGRGVDAVIVTATTTSNEPMHQAAMMCRKRGRIVLVGVAGLELSRADFFEKELTFQVSCSYGPGRYDPNYEEKGNDYPVGFVRWTEQRNFEAVLDMMSDGRLNLKPLISHRFDIAEANEAYELIGRGKPSLGILLKYPGINVTTEARTISLPLSDNFHLVGKNDKKVSVSFIGAGNYAAAVLIPAFKENGAHLYGVASSTGVSGLHAARKFGFEQTTTDSERLISDVSTDVVAITTQHNSHAGFVLQSLRANKHVFVEKPLCLTLDELSEIEAAFTNLSPDGIRHHKDDLEVKKILMVGFNRRFAPQVRKIKHLLNSVNSPKTFVLTVNAGAIPVDHWTQDRETGGGRIVGEACHFIDLLRFLAASPVVNWNRVTMDAQKDDTATITLNFADGSIGTVHYFSNGARAFPKERLEVFSQGRVLQLDNYRKLKAYGWPGFRSMNMWRQDKGQKACVKAFLDAVIGCGPSPIPVEEILEVSRLSIEIAAA